MTIITIAAKGFLFFLCLLLTFFGGAACFCPEDVIEMKTENKKAAASSLVFLGGCCGTLAMVL